MSARYLVNAGRVPSGSWYADEHLEGSRWVGEGGHFVDTLSWWVGHRPVEVSAHATGDGADLHATLRFEDGSIASVDYCTSGAARVPKETLDVSGGGRNARLENFTRATAWSGTGRDVKRALTGPDKGQRAEVAAFVEAVRRGGEMPIGLDSLVTTTRTTIAVAEGLASGRVMAP
jgi:predicted dehydrogenase